MVPPTINQPDIVDISNMLLVFSDSSKAFNENCDELKQSDLHIGDKVTAFSIVYPLDASSNLTRSATSIFLKRTQ